MKIQLLAAFFTLTPGLFAASTDCATPDKVTLQLKWVTQAQFAGYYAAQDLGHYKDACLEVTIRPGGLHLEPEEVVGKGDAQFGIAWQPGMLAARDRGVPLNLAFGPFAAAAIVSVALMLLVRPSPDRPTSP